MQPIIGVPKQYVTEVPRAIEVNAADVTQHHNLVDEHFCTVAAVVLALTDRRVHRSRRVARIALNGTQVRLDLLEEVRLRVDAGRCAPPVSARQVRAKF